MLTIQSGNGPQVITCTMLAHNRVGTGHGIPFHGLQLCVRTCCGSHCEVCQVLQPGDVSSHIACTSVSHHVTLLVSTAGHDRDADLSLMTCRPVQIAAEKAYKAMQRGHC